MVSDHNSLASARFGQVGRLSSSALAALMLRGETPDMQALAGWEYRGMNTPLIARLLGLQKFIKGFYRAADGSLFGYNTPVQQNGLRRPWLARPSPAQPRRFGYYRAMPVDPTAHDNLYLRALLLDYGQGGNPRFDPTALIRDYLVRLRSGSDDLLLGRAFLALGPFRLPVSYFVLERYHLPSDNT